MSFTHPRLKIKNYLHGPYEIGNEAFSGPPPPENKWWPGDRLAADGKVVMPADRRAIHGVLDLLNRTGQGFSPRGVPLYLCHPLDPAYPPFLVAYKERGISNILVTIRCEHWEGRWPRGSILKNHGPIGNTATERNLLCDTYNVTQAITPDVDVAFPPVLDHESVEWEHAFNVDPFGTEDVDDIFAWRTVGDVKHFMIAIADVAAWVPPQCNIDIRAYELGQTLYDNGVVITPMLPTSLSSCSASLRCDGVARPVVGLVFEISDGVVRNANWRKYRVRLTAVHTYESVLEDTAIASQLYDFLDIVCDRRIDPTDTHDWVAQAMIKYNHSAAQLLHSVGLGVLRRQEGMRSTEYAAVAEASGCGEIAMFGAAAGKYCVGSALQTSHSGLGLNVYCHASSPLRRYADLVNQRMLKYLLFGETWVLGKDIAVAAETVVTHLNDRAYAAKWLERELWFLAALRADSITEASGICLKLKDESAGRWSVYVPAWRRKMTGVCGEGVGSLVPGARVHVRAYCDLRRPSWRDRIVCQLNLA